MDIAQLFAFIGKNPEFAPQLDAMGIPAPDMGQIMKLGGPGAGTPNPGALIPDLMPGAVPPGMEAPVPPGLPTGGVMPPGPSPMDAALAGIQGGEGGGNAAGVAAAPGGAGNSRALAALAGLKAFEPQKAPMSGGVTGTRAPEMMAVKAGVPSIQALLAAALGAGGTNSGVPNLGSLIRG